MIGCQFIFICDGVLVWILSVVGWCCVGIVVVVVLFGYVEVSVGMVMYYYIDWVVLVWWIEFVKIVQIGIYIFYCWFGCMGMCLVFVMCYCGGEMVGIGGLMLLIMLDDMLFLGNGGILVLVRIEFRVLIDGLSCLCLVFLKVDVQKFGLRVDEESGMLKVGEKQGMLKF